ncbi:MAG TPA: DUF5317 domain-containing protein [Actinomycetota bacterium]
MLLLILVLLSVALVPVFGGHPRSLAEIRLGSIVLLLAAVALQAALILFPGGTNVIRIAAYIGSYVLAAGFLVRNSAIPGLWLIALGAALNFSAIVSNGGVMPAAPYAMSVAGLPLHLAVYSNSIPLQSPQLALFGDIFAIPASWPFANIYSLGDICIAIGAVVTVHRISGSRMVPSGAGRFAGVLRDRGAARGVAAHALSSVAGWSLAAVAILRVASSAGSVEAFTRSCGTLVVIGLAGAVAGGACSAILPSGRRSVAVACGLRVGGVLSLAFAAHPSLVQLAIVAAILGGTGPSLRSAARPRSASLAVAGDATLTAVAGLTVCMAPGLATVLVSAGGVAIALLAIGPLGAGALLLTDPHRKADARADAEAEPAPPDRRLGRTSAVVPAAVLLCGCGLAAAIPFRPGTGTSLLASEPDLHAILVGLGFVVGVFGAGLALGAIATPALSSRLRPERLFPWALLPLVVLLPAAGTQDLSQLLAAWLAAGVTVSVASLAARSLARAPAQEGAQPQLQAIPGVAASSGLLLGVGAARLLELGFDVVSVLVLATALVLLAAGTARFLLLGSQVQLGDAARP